MQPPSRDAFPFDHDPVRYFTSQCTYNESDSSFQDSLITETLVSVITKAVITLDDGEQRLVAVKEGKAKKHLVLEPHDIIKELRLLSSLSHPAVRLHMSHPAA
jgi:hypothetical protein